MKLNNYPNYKPCHIGWCRLIPVHWKQAQLRVCIDFATNGLSCNQTEQTATTTAVSRIETISEGKFNFEKVGHIERSEADPRRLMRKGDLAFSNINSLSMIGNCAIHDSDDEIYAGMNLLHIRPKQIVDPKWLYWLMRSNSFRSDVESNSKPAINQASIPQSKLVSIQIPIPQSKLEQSEISRFLDHETAKIDALIAEQERLIELLQEKRQAVISHAVTKGLNPDAPMKDSGVEWLGEVPDHWVGCRFKHCLMGLTDAEHKTCPDHEEGEYLIIRTSNIREGILITEGAKYTDANGYKEWTTRCTPQAGDVVFTREAPAGEACIIPEGVTACLGQRTVLMHPRLSKVTPEFLVSSIYSGAAQTFIQNLSQGSTVSHLNMSEIGNMPIALPPLDEQLEINKFTKEKSRKFDVLIKQARASTKLLQERRSALISAAVTGQIDVRGLAPQEEAA